MVSGEQQFLEQDHGPNGNIGAANPNVTARCGTTKRVHQQLTPSGRTLDSWAGALIDVLTEAGIHDFGDAGNQSWMGGLLAMPAPRACSRHDERAPAIRQTFGHLA